MPIKPISEILHSYIAKRLKEYRVENILDIGGTDKMSNRGFQTINANKRQNIDGRNLPFEDNSFDATVSIATLEHVGNIKDQIKFIKEAVRTCKYVSLHWFPINDKAERFLKEIGHNHPCIIPNYEIIVKKLNLKYITTEFTNVKEHLLLLATMYPKLNVPELYDYILLHGHETFGIILEITK
jgi:ubiquinone/menaquinone biosynthesis C-methylase UbiE